MSDHSNSGESRSAFSVHDLYNVAANPMRWFSLRALFEGHARRQEREKDVSLLSFISFGAK